MGKIRRIVFLVIVFGILIACNKTGGGVTDSNLKRGFKNIPDSVELSAYWYWINGNITRDGVVKDLKSMKEAGIGRAYIANIGLDDQIGNPEKQVRLLSDDWWDITRQAFKAADSLGVEIGLFNGPGWSQSGGPWVKPQESMRYLSTTAYHIRGAKEINMKLKEPDSNFQRTAILAYPMPKDFDAQKPKLAKLKTAPELKNSQRLMDGDLTNTVNFPESNNPNSQYIIDLTFSDEIKAHSLLLYPSKTPFKANVELEVKEGDRYKTIKDFEFNRTNMQRNVGFLPYAPVVIAIPETVGKEFRLVFSDVSPKGALAEIELSSQVYLDRYVEKQLGKMFQTPLPTWDAYQWKGQEYLLPEPYTIQVDSVRNITRYLSNNGFLNWNAPEGEWVILDVGMVPTGVTNAPATPEATGLEVDKMSKSHLENHFNSFIGEVLRKIPKEDRKSFKYVVADSYETGSQTWTDDFLEKFTAQYGYSPLKYVPVLSGSIVGSIEESNRFLWDMRRLIADQIAYEYVGGLKELSNKNGLKNWLENYGHWGFPAEFLQYGGQADEIGGEFWTEGELGSIELKAASSAANIYGKNKVFAESFTSGAKAFSKYPGSLKQRGDWAFTEGINSTLLHLFISQPYSSPKPGINAWFGTEFNRNNTWFEMGKAFFDYLRRNNYMLQQGRPVRDVAYFIGENAPVMTGIKEPELPVGYSYDYINAEVIKNRLSVKDGKLILPNGISYNLLVLPPLEKMRPDLLRRIKDLINEGAVVLGPMPKESPSLQDFPKADKEVEELAQELWQDVGKNGKKVVSYGKGRVLNDMDMKEAFSLLNVKPDMEFDDSLPVLFTHRKMEDGAHIYFVSNQSDSLLKFTPSFRVVNKQPEWWDPTNGSANVLPQFEQEEEHTEVPLTLEAYESGFVVFYKKMDKKKSTGKNFPKSEIVKRLQTSWEVTFRDPNDSISIKRVFDNLQSWTDYAEDEIKYFSGTAVYNTKFDMTEILNNRTFYLDIGEVGVMAKVFLNNEEIGTVWTAPWRIDITGALRNGENELRIEVVNTWANRLIGDSSLPQQDKRAHAEVNPYKPNDTLMSSGLMGPITIQATSENNH